MRSLNQDIRDSGTQSFFLDKLVNLFLGDDTDLSSACGNSYHAVAALRLLFCPDQ